LTFVLVFDNMTLGGNKNMASYTRYPREYHAVHSNPYFLSEDGFLTRVALALREIIHNGIAYKAKNFWIYNIQRAIPGTRKFSKSILIAHDGIGFKDLPTLDFCLELLKSQDSGVQGQGMKASAFYLAPKEVAELIVDSRTPTGEIIAERLRVKDASQAQERMSLEKEPIDGVEYLDFLSKNLKYKDTNGKEVVLDFTKKANVFVLYKYEESADATSDGAVTLAAVNTLMRICRLAKLAQINFFPTKFFGDGVESVYGGEGELVARKASDYDNLFAIACHEELVTIKFQGMTYTVKVDLTHYPCITRGGNTALYLTGPSKGAIAHRVGAPSVVCEVSGDFRLDKNDHCRLLDEPVFFLANREKKKEKKSGPRWNSSFCRALGIKDKENAAQTLEEIAAIFDITNAGSESLGHSPLTTFSFHITPTQTTETFGQIGALFFANYGLDSVADFTKMVIDKLAMEMDDGKREDLKAWVKELNEKFFPPREFKCGLPEIPLDERLSSEHPPLELEAAEDLFDGAQKVFSFGQQLAKVPVPYRHDHHWHVFVRHPREGTTPICYETAEIVDSSKTGIPLWNGVSLRKTDMEIDGKCVYMLEVSRARFRKDKCPDYYPSDKKDYEKFGIPHRDYTVSPSRWFDVQVEGKFPIYCVKIEIVKPSLGRAGAKPKPNGLGKGNHGDYFTPYTEMKEHPCVFGVPKRDGKLHLNVANRQIAELAEFANSDDLKRKHEKDWISLYRAMNTAMVRMLDTVATLKKITAKDEYTEDWINKFGAGESEMIGLLNDKLRTVIELHPAAQKIRASLNKANKLFDDVIGEKYGVLPVKTAA
jgi:hypothetical protein